MKKLYKSKIGLELIIPIIIVLGVVLFITASEKPHWVGPIILLPIVLFIVHMFSKTYYVIDGNSLTIKCGFFSTAVDVNTVTKISETNNPISSPALSLDRIEIAYGKFQSVIISPKLKNEFISDLIALNAAIEVKYKNKQQ